MLTQYMDGPKCKKKSKNSFCEIGATYLVVLILGSSMNKIIKRQESPSWSSSWRPLTLMALEANKDETGWPGTPADAPRPPKLKKQRKRKLVQ